MQDDQLHYDSFETTLIRVEAAEKARVFSPTPIDPVALLRTPKTMTGIRFARQLKFALPFAAAAMLVMGVWGAMWNSQLGRLRDHKVVLTYSVVENDCDGSFLKCFNGLDHAKTACRTFDYDRDGDVDLADYRTYQVDCDGPVAMR